MATKTDRTKSYTAKFVLQRADVLIAASGNRNAKMDRYERMYRMDVWEDKPKGVDDVRLSLPIAFDLVEKMRALLVTRPPVISVPWSNAVPEDEDNAQLMEKFLYGVAGRTSMGRVLSDAEWFAMCLGKGWLKLVYNSQAVDGESPLLLLSPDPRTLYETMSSTRDRCVELAHIWERTRSEIMDEWGVDLDMPAGMTLEKEQSWLDEKVEYIEYWREISEWTDDTPEIEIPSADLVMQRSMDNMLGAMTGAGGMSDQASIDKRAEEILADIDDAPELDIKEPDQIRVRRILHCVVVRDSTVLDGAVTVKQATIVPGYSIIPYVKWSGISTPLPGENSDLSILYALTNGDGGKDSLGVLQAWNQLASLDMVEAMNAANPPLLTDDDTATINANAGEITTVQKDRMVRPMREPGTSQSFARMSDQMSRMVDRVGLPEVWSGMTQNLSGQAISGLATAFTMLLGFKQMDRERAIEQVLTLALALAKEYADPEEGWQMFGVNAYGKDVQGTLRPSIIPRHPRVRVKLSASMPKDDMAFVSMLVQLVNNDLLSYESALDQIQKTIGLSADTTNEEFTRILRGKIMLKSELSQQLGKFVSRDALRTLLINAGADPEIADRILGLEQPQQPALPPAGGGQAPPTEQPPPVMPPGGGQGMPMPTGGLPSSVLPATPEMMMAAGRVQGGDNMMTGINPQEMMQ